MQVGAESQYLKAFRPAMLHIVFGMPRSQNIFFLAITKKHSSASLAWNVSRVHCRRRQFGASGVMGFPYFFHKPDRVEPVAVLHEMNCCAPRRRNYVQFYADKLRPMLGTTEFTITLPKSGAHSFKLCIGVESVSRRF